MSYARPAGLLVNAVKKLDSEVTVAKADGDPVLATKLMAIMRLNIKSGNTVVVTVEGGDEESNAAVLEQFFRDNL